MMRLETPHKLWSLAGELNCVIAGSIIKSVWAPYWSLSRFDRAKKVGGQVHPSTLVGWYFSSVETYGKSLLLKLENFGIGTRYIGCNLGHGNWFVRDHYFYVMPWSDSIQIVFILNHPEGYDYQLIFYDRKHNGKLEIREHIHDLKILNRYGPPIDSPYFTLEWVQFVVSNSQPKKNTPYHLHNLLMRQEYFAGLTNKLVSEICFLANLHPNCLAINLSDDQVSRLYRSILIIFSTFSRHRGHHEYMIFGRYKCPICSANVEHCRIRNFPTYFCPVCQNPDFKEPKPISHEFVDQILAITKNLDYVKNGIEEYNARTKQQRFLSANVSEAKDGSKAD